MSKFKVSQNHRVSDLSHIATEIEVELIDSNNNSMIYENVHYPESFINKAFARNSDFVKGIIRRKGEGSVTEMNRPDGI
jgi:hypothetical protein